MSKYLHNKLRNDYRKNNSVVNKLFYNLYYANKGLILEKINGANKIKTFFEEYKKVFIDNDFSGNDCSNFINNISSLFFNQILSLIVLWHIAEFSSKKKIIPIVFCLDNLDVLVNHNIITGFFGEYYRFVRNIDSIIQELKSAYIQELNSMHFDNLQLEYNKMFTFIFSCRQHTWAKVKKSHLHQGNFIELSTYEKNITDAFNKNAILAQREQYIKNNQHIYNGFSQNISNVKSLIADMNEWNNIYDLFNDDYRQCTITFEKILEETPKLLAEYIKLKEDLSPRPLYGARVLIYKALFDKFRDEGLFKLIGVLDFNSLEPPVSDARMILNYLDYHTYGTPQKSVPFETIVKDFDGIITEDRINHSLIQMFKLGVENSIWNELIAFDEINNDELESCKGTKVFITKAGHEYLDLLSTHFEFFNVRVVKRRITDASLFSNMSMQKYQGNEKYTYNFQETIRNVIDVVDGCCKKMSTFYDEIMFKKFNGKENYLESAFVYSNNRTKVLHGEGIIHTHIRYIDHYRLFVLKDKPQTKENDEINKILLDFIKEYINIGKNNPNITTSTSKILFSEFDKKFKLLKIVVILITLQRLILLNNTC